MKKAPADVSAGASSDRPKLKGLEGAGDSADAGRGAAQVSTRTLAGLQVAAEGHAQADREGVDRKVDVFQLRVGVAGGYRVRRRAELVFATDVGRPGVDVRAARVDGAPAGAGVQAQRRVDEVGGVATQAPHVGVDAVDGFIGQRTRQGQLVQIGLGLGGEARDAHVAEFAAGVDAAADVAVVLVGGAVQIIGEGAIQSDGPVSGDRHGEAGVDLDGFRVAAQAQDIDVRCAVGDADRADAVLGESRGSGEGGEGGGGEEERLHFYFPLGSGGKSRCGSASYQNHPHLSHYKTFIEQRLAAVVANGQRIV